MELAFCCSFIAGDINRAICQVVMKDISWQIYTIGSSGKALLIYSSIRRCAFGAALPDIW